MLPAEVSTDNKIAYPLWASNYDAQTRSPCWHQKSIHYNLFLNNTQYWKYSRMTGDENDVPLSAMTQPAATAKRWSMPSLESSSNILKTTGLWKTSLALVKATTLLWLQARACPHQGQFHKSCNLHAFRGSSYASSKAWGSFHNEQCTSYASYRTQRKLFQGPSPTRQQGQKGPAQLHQRQLPKFCDALKSRLWICKGEDLSLSKCCKHKHTFTLC